VQNIAENSNPLGRMQQRYPNSNVRLKWILNIDTVNCKLINNPGHRLVAYVRMSACRSNLVKHDIASQSHIPCSGLTKWDNINKWDRVCILRHELGQCDMRFCPTLRD